MASQASILWPAGGAGDFIGGRLVQRLLAGGATELTAVDIKPPDESRWISDQMCAGSRTGPDR